MEDIILIVVKSYNRHLFASLSCVMYCTQVRHLYVTRELNACPLQRSATIRRPVNIDRRGECAREPTAQHCSET